MNALAVPCMLVLFAVPAQADSGLYAGAAKVDITPPTGYRTDGWATNDRAVGVITRLYARALVLADSGQKVALVTTDLVGASGGVVKEATALVKNLGFSESNVLVSGTHTHSGTGQFATYGELNAAFPSEKEALTNFQKFADFAVGGPPDPQVYAFLIRRVALAIRLADRNLGPAVAGWSDQQLLGVTQNRSLEAHLANFGLNIPNHEGSPSQDPGGYPDTIDPALPVLRVDKLVKRHGRLIREPIGAWTDFANHGTIVQHTFAAYGGDHQATAERMFEDAVRRAGHVPARQAVINAFADGAEGDMSSGLVHNGPAWATHVGALEAQAMLRGWRAAGRHLTRHPALTFRWTRVCFCGQTVKGGGAIDTKSVIGLPVFTGSEEGRGPLYDATGVSFEGRHLPTSIGPQGDKIPVVVDSSHQDDPNAVPIQVIRIGDHLLADVPGEPTVEMGRLMRSAILTATSGSGVRTVAIVGLAIEYVAYYTTPAEFKYQDYEGGHTVYGRWSGYFIRDMLADLAGRLASGRPAPAPYPFDPTNGIKDTGAPYGAGAASGSIVAQPATVSRFAADSTPRGFFARAGTGALTYKVAYFICVHSDLAARSIGDVASLSAAAARVPRLGRIAFSWRGGPRGFDRPLDRAFITVQRHIRRRRWSAVVNDLGNQILWTVDSGGVYRAVWQVPLGAHVGRYRFLITANRYHLTSRSFVVVRSRGLTLHPIVAKRGRVAVALGYPPAMLASELDTDLTDRPAFANGGTVIFKVGRRRITVRRRAGVIFTVRAPVGKRITVLSARDRYGNLAAAGLTLSR